MKLLVLTCLAAVAWLAAAEMKTGMKLRLTKHAFDEYVKVSTALNDQQLKTIKEMLEQHIADTKNDSSHTLLSHFGWIGADMGDSPKLEQLEVVKYNMGEHSLSPMAPNAIHGSCTGFELVIKIHVSIGGKSGTVELGAGPANIEYKVAFSRTDDGKLQFAQEQCSVDVQNIKAVFQGFEDDEKMNEEAKGKIAEGETFLNEALCPMIEQFVAMANVMITQSECTMDMGKVKGAEQEKIDMTDMHFSMCLSEDPVATAEGIDFAFEGATIYKEDLGSPVADYDPAPLATQGDLNARMIYYWAASEMMNKFMRVAFAHDRLVVTLTEDEYPEAMAIIKQALKGFSAEAEAAITDDAKLTSKFVDKETPTITLSGDKTDTFTVKANTEVTHTISVGGADVATFGGTLKVTSDIACSVAEPEPEMMFPRLSCKVKVQSLELTEAHSSLSEIDEAKRVELEAKIKSSMEDVSNEIIEKMMNKEYKLQGKQLPKPARFFKIANAELLFLKDTMQMSGDIKVDLDKFMKTFKKQMKMALMGGGRHHHHHGSHEEVGIDM